MAAIWLDTLMRPLDRGRSDAPWSSSCNFGAFGPRKAWLAPTDQMRFHQPQAVPYQSEIHGGTRKVSGKDHGNFNDDDRSVSSAL